MLQQVAVDNRASETNPTMNRVCLTKKGKIEKLGETRR